MIYGKLNLDGTLIDLGYREPLVWDDGGIDVPLIAMPANYGPFGYDAENQIAIPFFPPLAQYKLEKIAALNNAAIQLVESRYPPTVQAGFAGVLAASASLPNRAAYCQQLLNWAATVVGAYATLAGQVNAATDEASIDAITLDATTLLAADPKVTLMGAFAINS